MTYTDKQAALLTKHEKLPLIAPSLATLGLTLTSTDAFDTDQLGTFSGEIERAKTPLECARFKAKKACELTGLDIGIGSEGSFGGGPMPGFVNWDEEVLVFVDLKQGLEVVAYAQGPIKVSDIKATSWSKTEWQINQFHPQQRWTLSTTQGLLKGVQGFARIAEVIRMQGVTDDKQLREMNVRLAPDYRAMHCPERQDYIRQAAEQLAARMRSACPQCQAPNFWRTEAVKGALCTACQMPSDHPKAYILRCSVCQYEREEPSENTYIDPWQCQFCNP